MIESNGTIWFLYIWIIKKSEGDFISDKLMRF